MMQAVSDFSECEFLYLGRNDFPTEEEQFQAYKQVVQTMAGKKVIIRTLISGRISRWTILILEMKRIRHWDTVRSVSV